MHILNIIPKRFCYDNKVAINIANKPAQHNKTKHIEFNRHFIMKLNSGLDL